jgi:HlyD family secretion protein
MSLSCTVILEEEKEVICVPIEAVYENDDGEEYVNKIKDDGTVEETVIETGIADDSYVQVVSGLELNDKVQIITETTESSTTSSDSQTGLSGFGSGDMQGGDMSQGGDMQGGKSDFSGGNGGEMPSGGNRGEMPSGGSMPSGNK